MSELPRVSGAHVLLYSTDARADRAFFQDVLQLESVDAGGGWSIFALPPTELAVHLADSDVTQAALGEAIAGTVLYLMTPDLRACVQSLTSHRISCAAIQHQSWGEATTITLPSGARIGLYQPAHPMPHRTESK